MSNIGMRLVRISAAYMLVAVIMGVFMGISGDFSLSSVHSHVALLGWAAMSISGILYLLLPACAGSRLAQFHFWGHNAGLPVMVASLGLYIHGVDRAEPGIGIGSMVILASLTVFTVNLYLNGRPGRV
jgi:cbb3-type cytochrome oxidase subunit 1